MTTRISVCMATYNGSLFLGEQLTSILSQLGPDDELIISDDHSTDETLSILAGYTDPRIRLIANPGRRGHVQNFAYAMQHASGEFIALSDQDDIWVENRLERMVERLRRLPPCSLAIGDFTEFGLNATLETQAPLGPNPVNRTVGLLRIFLGRAKYFGSAFLFRRDLLRYVLPIPPYIEAHDIWIAMNAALRGKVDHLEEVTVMRRLHGSNLSPLRRRGLLKILRSRVLYLEGLLRTCSR